MEGGTNGEVAVGDTSSYSAPAPPPGPEPGRGSGLDGEVYTAISEEVLSMGR